MPNNYLSLTPTDFETLAADILSALHSVHFERYGEGRDGLDVKFASILFDLGYLPIPLCSELCSTDGYLEALEADAILISGGNDIGAQPKRDMLETRLLDYAKECQIPVIGICRGTQLINQYSGGSQIPITGHVAKKHVLLGDWAIKQGYGEVNSYHNFGITQDTIAPSLNVLAYTQDGVVEALKHESLPWLGIMWHPEREETLSNEDKNLLAKHFHGFKV